MPDWNPDREAHREHKWIVHNATRREITVEAAGKAMPFNIEGRFSVSDESVAAEIRKKYPRAATVTRVSTYHPSDRGHRYFHVCPALPWHKESRQEAGSGEDND